MDSQKGAEGKHSKTQLIVALVVVVMGAIVLTAGLTWLFAFNQLGYLYFWERPGDISGGEWQNHIRNAATLVGVPGVAAALVFSYFKQRTSDRTQETTAAVLDLQHEQHKFETVSRYRSRYTVAAEQLGHDKESVQLAGLYALAGLADDWALIDRPRDRQECIDMIVSTLESTQRNAKGSPAHEITHIESRIKRMFDTHYRAKSSEASWSDTSLDLAEYNRPWGSVVSWISTGGIKTFTASTFSRGNNSSVRKLSLSKQAIFRLLVHPSQGLTLSELSVEDQANLTIEFTSEDPNTTSANPHFRDSIFSEGSILFIKNQEFQEISSIIFESCEFDKAQFMLPEGLGEYTFIFSGCTFKNNPFDMMKARKRKPEIELIDNCIFEQRMNGFTVGDDSFFDSKWRYRD